MDNMTFNHKIQVDVMFICGDQELHIIDRGTRYSVFNFIDNQSIVSLYIAGGRFGTICGADTHSGDVAS